MQSFTYDVDGNLTSDGVWDYTYDAENRLLRMQTTTAAANAGLPNRLIDFKYDYLGRRVEKKVADWNGSTWAFQTQHRYLYDGWNLVAEFSSTTEGTLGTLLRSYTWGLDVAGSFSATGGVGALLQIHDYSATKTLLATYDGNGNVAALLNDTSGTVEAAYEYSPFGELLRSEGTYAKENPFRFSTKYRDDETGLVYYGHRYYAPTLGRFINRDPIAEAGGINLYGFALNNPVTSRDVLGMFPDEDWSDYTVEEVYTEKHYRGNWGYSRTRYWGTHTITGERKLLHTETEYYDDDGEYFDEDLGSQYDYDWADQMMDQMDAVGDWMAERAAANAAAGNTGGLWDGLKNLFGSIKEFFVPSGRVEIRALVPYDVEANGAFAGPSSGNENSRWVEGAPTGPYYGTSVNSQVGPVAVALDTSFSTLNPGQALPGASTATLRPDQAGVTRVVISGVQVAVGAVEGRPDTYSVTSVNVNLMAHVTWNSRHLQNGEVPRFLQFAEYQHYAAYAGGVQQLADAIYDRVGGSRFGRQVELQARFDRTVRNIVNEWYSRRSEESAKFDRPGGPHTLGGPRL